MTALLVSGVSASVASPTPARVDARTPVFFGISVPNDDPDRVADATAAAGVAPTVDGIFTRFDAPSLTVDALRAIRARGMTPMVTLEPWIVGDVFGSSDLSAFSTASVARGEHDAQVRRLATTIAAAGVPVYLRYAHEMNGWWYPWAIGQNGNTDASYIAAWRRVTDILRAVAGSLVRMVWSPAALLGSPREQDARSAYPGDLWVDVVGIDVYAHAGDPATAIDPTYRLVIGLTSRPIVLCEVGADGADKAAWLAAFGAAVADRPAIRGFVWNNATRSTGASGDYRFDDNDSDAASFRVSLRRLGIGAPRPDGETQ